MKLFIKNMVCNRCILVAKTRLEEHGLHPAGIALGEVELQEEKITAQQLTDIGHSLKIAGFQLIDDRKSRIIEKIKTTIINLVHYSKPPHKEKHSALIAKELHYDYSYLSTLFSEVEGITIEQYIISQKIEKVKEYIIYDELSLSEIADGMGYSSAAHLSSQFKKATGLPPSHFKNVGVNQRKSLDKTGTL